MDEQCGISMQFNYSGIKRDETLTRATSWLNPENFTLRGKAGHKSTWCKAPFIRNVQNIQIHRNSRLVLASSRQKEQGVIASRV